MPKKKPVKKSDKEIKTPKTPSKSRTKKRIASASVKKKTTAKALAKKRVVKKTKASKRSVSKKDQKDMQAAVEAIPSLIFEEVLFDVPVVEAKKNAEPQGLQRSVICGDKGSASEVKKKQSILVIGVTLFSTLIALVWGVSLKAKIGNISFKEGLVGGEVETSLTGGYAELSETLSVIKEQKSATTQAIGGYVSEVESAEKKISQDVKNFETSVISSVAEKISKNTPITTPNTTRVEGLESLQ